MLVALVGCRMEARHPGHTSSISTQLSHLFTQSSSHSQNIASDQFVFLASSIVGHTRQILSSIHLILTRPPPPAVSWLSHPFHPSDSELDTLFVPPPQSVDENETFTVSLFDETDDVKLITSLNRCLAVVTATKSAKCIDDIDAFRTRLVSGLHSSNLAVQSHCHRLFFQFGDILRIVDDPHDDRFASLSTAINDGSTMEKSTLLEVWGAMAGVHVRV
ncbi:hypothetical protein BLNAU_11209 [Blattamonas nauphoetae]|uniref:Uncharacterized protein n=1 Tax=Blattamonas nauphoetae TaxID=2049346 RepID=A0ABQ9XP42_9EUKA|nr:hypothetical protein BLNAU_11209 [Blattamonas nauphoetae]